MNLASGLDILFPPRCSVCDRVLPFGRRGACPECLKRLPWITEPRCFCCGKTVEREEAEYCGDCARKKHLFRRAFPLLQYVPPVSDALTALKYHGRAEYAEFYGGLLAEHFHEELKALDADCLVPVPVHPHRLRKRGYNQAGLIARAMSKKLGIPGREDLLLRAEDTVAQKKLSREERALNLRAAFQAGGETPPPTVLLVDDILTTGATADACADVLLRAGAKHIYLVTVSA